MPRSTGRPRALGLPVWALIASQSWTGFLSAEVNHDLDKWVSLMDAAEGGAGVHLAPGVAAPESAASSGAVDSER